MSLRAKEILGLELERFFRFGSRASFFTLAVGRTDTTGSLKVTVPAYPLVDVEVSAGGSTVSADVAAGGFEVHVRMEGGA